MQKDFRFFLYLCSVKIKNMDKEINNNGFSYVDLGLPSGTLWSTCNVGASKPSEYGLYFQWGDTNGYTKEQLGIGEGKKAFRWSDYKFRYQESSLAFTKYRIPGATLDLEDDAAHVNMEGDWHMPSPSQIEELLDNTTTAWTTSDGVSGMTFTSKKDESKLIFIPAAGFAWDGSVHYSGGNGGVWSSMLYTDLVDSGQYLYFGSGNVDLNINGRCSGLSVRGVVG